MRAHLEGLGLGERRTADPSTSLRYGRDDKFVWGAGLKKTDRFVPFIPSLTCRQASQPLGMTILLGELATLRNRPHPTPASAGTTHAPTARARAAAHTALIQCFRWGFVDIPGLRRSSVFRDERKLMLLMRGQGERDANPQGGCRSAWVVLIVPDRAVFFLIILNCAK